MNNITLHLDTEQELNWIGLNDVWDDEDILNETILTF